MYTFNRDDWHTLGNILAFDVACGLHITRGLQITPSSPIVGQDFTANFSLLNAGTRSLTLPAVGIGGQAVDCVSPECTNNAGLTAYFNVTIPAGGRYDYGASRRLDLRAAITSNPLYSLPNLIGGRRSLPCPMASVFLTIQPGIAVVEPLTVSPPAPLAGEIVTVRFKLRNASDRRSPSGACCHGRGPTALMAGTVSSGPTRLPPATLSWRSVRNISMRPNACMPGQGATSHNPCTCLAPTTGI